MSALHVGFRKPHNHQNQYFLLLLAGLGSSIRVTVLIVVIMQWFQSKMLSARLHGEHGVQSGRRAFRWSKIEWDCLVRQWKEGAARLEMEMSVWVDSVQFSTYLPPKYERERVRRHLTRSCWTEKRIA